MGYMREVSNQNTWDFVSKLNYQNFDALEISGDRWSTMGFNSYKSLGYPEFDILDPQITDTFDLIVAEQVWEHIKYPFKAGSNVFNLLKPNGWFILTVPFLVRRHDHPIDCTRWTDEGLAGYFEEIGFVSSNIKTGTWGNLACVISNLTSWTISDKTDNSFQPMHNEVMYPICTWGFAQKT